MITFRISISTTPMEGAQQWFTEPQDKWQLITMSDKHRSAQFNRHWLKPENEDITRPTLTHSHQTKIHMCIYTLTLPCKHISF